MEKATYAMPVCSQPLTVFAKRLEGSPHKVATITSGRFPTFPAGIKCLLHNAAELDQAASKQGNGTGAYT